MWLADASLCHSRTAKNVTPCPIGDMNNANESERPDFEPPLDQDRFR
jgi:hypothetical protein